MPVQLLPASAAAFAPRAPSVNVVLGSRVDAWLTQTLKRINRTKRPLNSVAQHQRCLAESLSSPSAIWTLASLMLPKLAEPELPDDSSETTCNYRILHVEAYIVHVDMVLRNEIAFKLTSDSIDALVGYHKDVYCTNAKASTYDWPEKEQQCQILHNQFVQAINKYVFRTHVSALEGLEEDGAGELLCGKSEHVKSSLEKLMKPLLPPPPRVVDVVRQPPLLPSSHANDSWPRPDTLPAADTWRPLLSSPSATSSGDSNNTPPLWDDVDMSHDPMPFPTPALTPTHSAAKFFGTVPVSAPVSTLPLPSMLAHSQCGVTVGMGNFGWDRCQECATIM